MPSETCVAKLGCTGGNNLVPLGGHHGNRQALLDGSAAGGVAVQAVGDGGNDLVGAFRGSGKKAYGHGTFTPVGELVLAYTHLTIHIHAGSCCWGWSPGAMTGGGTLVLQSPALCGALSFLRAGEALHCCPGWGWVLLLGGTELVTSGYRSMLSPWWCSVQRVPDVVYSVLAVHLMQVFFALSVGAFLRA